MLNSGDVNSKVDLKLDRYGTRSSMWGTAKILERGWLLEQLVFFYCCTSSFGCSMKPLFTILMLALQLFQYIVNCDQCLLGCFDI